MRALLGSLLLPALLLAALVWLATDTRPSLSRPASLSLADLERGKALVDSLGLRHMREGESRQLLLSEDELDRVVNYLAARLAKGSASAHIALGQLVVRAALPLPLGGRYLNVELALLPEGAVLAPAELRLGRLPVPAFVAGDLVAWSLGLSPYSEGLAAARELLDSARLVGPHLALGFTWRGAAVERAVASGGGRGADEATLRAYRDLLRQSAERDFALLVGSAFNLARQRSESRDPVAENRAALTALAEKALGGRLLTRGGLGKPAETTGLSLAGREDMAQHFAVSAFIAATGGEGLSDLAGLYKELRDTRHGSGFSFTDLAADRAGSRFGEAGTHSEESARRLQQRMAGSREPSAYFPAYADLPEFMNEAEFHRRFGGVGEPPYRRQVDAIEARIAALPLYRP